MASRLLMEKRRLQSYPSDDSVRRRFFEGLRPGISRLFAIDLVLREAIDMPWLHHAIFGQSVMGANNVPQRKLIAEVLARGCYNANEGV